MLSESQDDLYKIIKAMRLDEATQMARLARPFGVSHSGFQVGAAALAHRGSQEGLLMGWNSKPRSNKPGTEHGERTCAEVAIIKKAQLEGWDTIDYFVTYAANKQDDWTGRDFHVLVPCGPCRCFFTRLLLRKTRLISPFTPVVSVNADTGEHRTFMLGQLLAECNDRHRHTPHRTVLTQPLLTASIN